MTLLGEVHFNQHLLPSQEGEWPSYSFVETKLSRFHYAFILFRASIGKRRVNASSIIKRLDPFKNVAPGLITSRIFRKKYVLLFESSKKAFDHTVVPTISLAAHAAYDSVYLQQRLIISAGVLRTSI